MTGIHPIDFNEARMVATRLCVLCNAVLSQYNPGNRCFSHQRDVTTRQSFVKIKDPGIKTTIEKIPLRAIASTISDKTADEFLFTSNVLANPADSTRALAITFKPRLVVSKLLAILDARASDIIERRHALAGERASETLESIGVSYAITRERVRQIENAAIKKIRRSTSFRECERMLKELQTSIAESGMLVSEEEYLNGVTRDRSEQNCLRFLFVLGECFFEIYPEDDDFVSCIGVDTDLAIRIRSLMRSISSVLRSEGLIADAEVMKRFSETLGSVPEQYRDERILRRWLTLSKQIGRSPFGEWGFARSPSVSPRNIDDFAYLVLRKSGSPMHFREIAKVIGEVSGKSAHVATTHNSLVKDERFVLVGRGLYGLSEWGFTKGVVREVIKEILMNEGPCTEEQVLEKVLRKRRVKPNTVLVNLRSKYFTKNSGGKYQLANT